MLGNFSFGDYFKEQSIVFGWELITKVLGLPTRQAAGHLLRRRRVASRRRRGARDLEEADRAARRSHRAVRRQGQLLVDGRHGAVRPVQRDLLLLRRRRSPTRGAWATSPPRTGAAGWSCGTTCSCSSSARAMASWTQLPAPSIDTGAGLERVACAMQGVRSNYDTDLLRPIVELASRISKKPYGGTLAPDDVSMRVIADHARTTAFLISEGIFPDREGRAVRAAPRDAPRDSPRPPARHRRAVPARGGAARWSSLMGEQYPELVERAALIRDITKQEEERFRRTLQRGLDLIAENPSWEQVGGQTRVARRGGVQALRHLRLPARPAGGHRSGAGLQHRPAGLRARDGQRPRAQPRQQDAPTRPSSACTTAAVEELGKTQFLGYERRVGAGQARRAAAARRARRRAERGRGG